jgi:hypothetical protein
MVSARKCSSVVWVEPEAKAAKVSRRTPRTRSSRMVAMTRPASSESARALPRATEAE